jgi:transposase InsO family protein
VSTSGYYDWVKRNPSQRAQENERLIVNIKRIHYEYREAYGSLKIWQALRQEGIKCGKHRVARLRSKHGIETKRRRKFKVTTRSRKGQVFAPNVVNRCFKAEKPNLVWVGDVTYISTRKGWLYLAIVMDLYSRMIVGWAMAEQNNKQLVLNALDMAILRQHPQPGLVHHTDQGSPYGSAEYVHKLKNYRMVQSMSNKGDCYDNAVAESFFATIKNELIVGNVFESREHARSEIFKYIEIFYNRKRIHQSLGYKTPQMIDQMSLN